MSHHQMKGENFTTMDTHNKLTQSANMRLIASLERFGNRLNIDHKMCLFGLNDSMTKMAEGSLQGRRAFGLPTGTGKTRAIIEWITAVHEKGLPYSVAVAASRIEALCTLKRDLVANGVPGDLIGLLHSDKSASEPATDENSDRPFMLITHQLIRANPKHLVKYNTYKGADRSLLLYDESLLISEVEHLTWNTLNAALAWGVVYYSGDNSAMYEKLSDHLKACHDVLTHTFNNWKLDDINAQAVKLPYIDPMLVSHFNNKLKHQTVGSTGTILQFLSMANSQLRMLRSGSSTVVTYDIVIPADLKNIVVLDASYPIRKLCLFDANINNAQDLPGLQQAGVVPFHTLKQFDNVTLYRLRAHGGRSSMEKDFKADKKMAKEVAQVVKTIPADEAVLIYVYKQNGEHGVKYQQIVEDVLEAEGVKLYDNGNPILGPDGRERIVVQTWGNETSLNCYSYVKHVFLVGILHRDSNELAAQYLGQIDNLMAPVDHALRTDLQLSEKAHLAYQALSRGSCRVMIDGQAQDMTGYIVEVSPEIEDVISKVMPGVKWNVWKPFFVEETDDLIKTWVEKVKRHLGSRDHRKTRRISSQALKKEMQADNVATGTWTKIIQTFLESTTEWAMDGKSLQRKTAEAYGFSDKAA